MTLETVAEESENDYNNNRRKSSDKSNISTHNFTKKLNVPGYVLSSLYLENALCDLKQDKFPQPNTYLAQPIMIHHHRFSFEASDAEISSNDRKSSSGICNSHISSNLHRSSIVSATFSGKHIWYGISLGTLIIMTTVLATLMIAWRPQQHQTKQENRNEFYIEAPWFITREQWRALEPRNKTYLNLPVPFVILGSTESVFASTFGECRTQWHIIQDRDMGEKEWNDIGFNYMICGNGLVFEGRGASVMGTHTRGYNSRSIMIALIGEYNETVFPPQIMMDRVDLLLEALINDNKVSQKCLLLAKSFVAQDLAKPSKHILTVVREWNNIWKKLK